MSAKPRRTKPFFSVDCEFPRHERLALCEDPAGCLGLWNALVATIREGEYEAPRVLKKTALAFFASDPRNAARLTDMITHELLACDDLYVEVLRYSPRNQLKKDIVMARKSAQARMKVVRANKPRTSVERSVNESRTFGEQPGDVPTSTSIYRDQKEERDPEAIAGATGAAVDPRPAGGKLPDHIVAFEKNVWTEAYERGVDRAKGGEPFGFPTKAFSALRAVVEKHCRGADRRNIGAWIERDAFEFVSAVIDSDDLEPKFFSDFGPDGLLKWHNKERPGLLRALARLAPSADDVDEPIEPRPMSDDEIDRAGNDVLEMLAAMGANDGR